MLDAGLKAEVEAVCSSGKALEGQLPLVRYLEEKMGHYFDM